MSSSSDISQTITLSHLLTLPNAEAKAHFHNLPDEMRGALSTFLSTSQKTLQNRIDQTPSVLHSHQWSSAAPHESIFTRIKKWFQNHFQKRISSEQLYTSWKRWRVRAVPSPEKFNISLFLAKCRELCSSTENTPEKAQLLEALELAPEQALTLSLDWPAGQHLIVQYYDQSNNIQFSETIWVTAGRSQIRQLPSLTSIDKQKGIKIICVDNLYTQFALLHYPVNPLYAVIQHVAQSSISATTPGVDGEAIASTIDQHKITAITAPAGTGKTTLVGRKLKSCAEQNQSTVAVAPSNKGVDELIKAAIAARAEHKTEAEQITEFLRCPVLKLESDKQKSEGFDPCGMRSERNIAAWKSNISNWLSTNTNNSPEIIARLCSAYWQLCSPSARLTPFTSAQDLRTEIIELCKQQRVLPAISIAQCHLFATIDKWNNWKVDTNYTSCVDHLMIDEAGQTLELSLKATLASTLAKTILLVGDGQQLPPTVKSTNQDIKSVLSHNMFRALSGKPSTEGIFANRCLPTTYRLSPLSVELINHLFTYDQHLTSGKPGLNTQLDPQKPWCYDGHSMIHCEGKIEHRGTSPYNIPQAACVARCAKQATADMPTHQVLILSTSQAQVDQIKARIDAAKFPQITISTVDGAQGASYDTAFLSVPNIASPFLYADGGGRLNVALTRSKGATVIIGNYNDLARGPTSPLLSQTERTRAQNLHTFLNNKQRIYNPPNLT